MDKKIPLGSNIKKQLCLPRMFEKKKVIETHESPMMAMRTLCKNHENGI
jgi:hypothetical protein